MSWEPVDGNQQPQEQQSQQQPQQRVTPISLALSVLKAMDVLRDTICRNSSLPREISEKCEEVCNKLKDMAFDLISYYNTRYYGRGGGRWRAQRKSGGLSRKWQRWHR